MNNPGQVCRSAACRRYRPQPRTTGSHCPSAEVRQERNQRESEVGKPYLVRKLRSDRLALGVALVEVEVPNEG
jgi:hypothetical protein